MPAEDEPWDDPRGVGPAEVLYRHVHPAHWVLDAATGQHRLASGFMSDKPDESDGISVYSATLLAQNGFELKDVPPSDKPTPAENYGIAELTAAIAREFGLDVVLDPDDERPVNIAHALLKPPKGISGKQWKRLARGLVPRFTIIRRPQLSDEDWPGMHR